MKTFFALLPFLFFSSFAFTQCNVFYDGFETGILEANWLFGTGTYTRTISASTPAVGSNSFSQSGSSGFYEGTYSTFPSSQPNYISFRIKTDNTSTANGYVVIGNNNIVSDNGIIFCYFNSTSELRFYGSTGQNFPINVNQWYHVEVQNINWTNRTSDIYLDGALILSSWPFRSSSANSMDRIHFFNLNNATASYDEIIFGSTPLTGLVNSSICANDSIVVNGTTYNAANPSGTEVFTNVGTNGCDSTVTVSLTVLPELTSTLNQTICYSDSIIVNGTTYNQSNPSGTEIFSNSGQNGCDSTVTINLNVESPIDLTIDSSIFPTLSANQVASSYQWVDCDNGNSPIAGATNQSFTATLNGNYAVVMTVGSCTEISSCESINGITSAGLSENALTNTRIFPNPTNGKFTIQLDGASPVYYTITTVDGKQLESGTSFNNSIDLTIEKEENGIYFVSISQAGLTKQFKLIKQ